MRLRVGFEHTVALQQYETLIKVVSQALGGEKKKADVVHQPKNLDEAEMMLRAVVG